MTGLSLPRARRLICRLHDFIHASLTTARDRPGATSFHRVAGTTRADTIYQVDRLSETAILAWFDRNWPKAWPVEVVMEGLEDDADATTFPRGTPLSRTLCKCILDPIDGTRELMYDKRSARILTGLAPQRGGKTTLRDITVAVMTELPVKKQLAFDQLSAVRGSGVVATRRAGIRCPHRRLNLQPSRAQDFDHGFASFSRFFPEGKTWLAELEEDLWRELNVWGKGGGAKVFDDQYISTGGQLYELAAGHDRLVADLRPLAFAALGLEAGMLCCHPYDICTALILEELGGVVEDPWGRPLRCPLDTTTSVAWVGYANRTLARKVRPVLRKILLDSDFAIYGKHGRQTISLISPEA